MQMHGAALMRARPLELIGNINTSQWRHARSWSEVRGSISRSSGSPLLVPFWRSRDLRSWDDFMAVVRRFRSGLLRPLGPHLATPGYRPSTSTSDKRYLRCLLYLYATGGEDHEWPVESVDLKANRYANAMSIDFVSPAGNIGQ